MLCTAQDLNKKYIDGTLSIGTFNTLNSENKISVNPAISGSVGDYYFESRYNYEAANSASLNIGRYFLKNSKTVKLVPMIGVIVGEFKGVTVELQSYFSNNSWYISADNQFSIHYKDFSKSLYLDWNVL
jgi:hypothetical protein